MKSLMQKLTFTLVAMFVMANPTLAEDSGMFSIQSLTPDTALKAASAALAKCRADGYQVAIAVVDRMGNMQVMLRDRFAGAHTPETARRKAWTAASFRTNTTDLVAFSQPGQVQSGIRQIPQVLMVGGGMIIESAGSLVGAIGVSGAPGGDFDDKCASAGIAAIEDALTF